MPGTMKLAAIYLGVAALLSMAAGCSEPSVETAAVAPPVHFQSADECHVCGMAIQPFPGPKGQAIGEQGRQVRKFCSTRDLLTWLLQPENIHRNLTVYVHDMARTDWQDPADTALVDAREAFYVTGSSRRGAMGPTVASFASRHAAQHFAMEFGGSVLEYGQVKLAHLHGDIAAPGEARDQAEPVSMEATSPHGHKHNQPE
ncbi:nitrous oxide reductase accessory protein NosL [Microbulbifer yueqingensis]|uniref:Copper chaperone NosL n=1 Tax=Microbulbifer yueqingensis TaxID=658219 RepID=A0A1G9ELK5_9GAMM|nr:nitrous oxide reductase accessory protein NosL [Microbulbifer yueqingensis]SDK76905.1 copper chaperone NosL [Microbulbifer yueqingensis]